MEEDIEYHVKQLDPKLVTDINSTDSIASRCLLAANYFGDYEEIQFWTIVKFCLPRFLGQGIANRIRFTSDQALKLVTGENTDDTATKKKIPEHIQPTVITSIDEINDPSKNSRTPSLPPYFDLLMDNASTRENELNWAKVRELKYNTYELQQKSAELHILLGEKDTAIQYLLKTPATNQNFYRDALKACVVAASMDPTNFKNTVKLIATNLIANGEINEGVQLLCLIGKSFDACRYLQTYDKWIDAAWLAKISLPDVECAMILKKWVQHLQSTQQRLLAVCVLLSMGDFESALQLLYDSQYYYLAHFFAHACMQFGLFLETASPVAKNEAETQKKQKDQDNAPPIWALLESINLAYGVYLHRLGSNKMAAVYLKQAGKSGINLLKSIEAGEPTAL